jgi:hypothetical protein
MRQGGSAVPPSDRKRPISLSESGSPKCQPSCTALKAAKAVRAMAEKVVDQSGEVYDRSKDALDASVATLGWSEPTSGVIA